MSRYIDADLKTMLDVFKERNPKAMFRNDGCPVVCPHHMGYTEFVEEHACTDENGFMRDCIDCWNRPYEDDGSVIK